jgi:hypothetical protein
MCHDIIADDERFIRARLRLPVPSDIDRFMAGLPYQSWEPLTQLLEESARQPPPIDPPLRCSFSNELQDRVEKLIAGPRDFICNRCVSRCTGRKTTSHETGLIELDMPAGLGLPLSPAERDSRRPLSDEERTRVRDAVRAELDRRYTAILTTLRAAGRSGAPVTDSPEEDDIEDLVRLIGWRHAQFVDEAASERGCVCLAGATSQLRQGLARRIHERSWVAEGPLVVLDGRVPGALAVLPDLQGGSVFLDHADALSAEAQEFLGLSLRNPTRVLGVRLMAGVETRTDFDARVEDGRFSGRLRSELCRHALDLDDPLLRA